jgi:hypothetical protein
MSEKKTECASCRCSVQVSNWPRTTEQECRKPATNICAEHLEEERAAARRELERRDEEIKALREQLRRLARAAEMAERARGLLVGETVLALSVTEPNVEHVYPGPRR